MRQLLGTADKDIRLTKTFISVIASERVKFEIMMRRNMRQAEGVWSGRMSLVC